MPKDYRMASAKCIGWPRVSHYRPVMVKIFTDRSSVGPNGWRPRLTSTYCDHLPLSNSRTHRPVSFFKMLSPPFEKAAPENGRRAKCRISKRILRQFGVESAAAGRVPGLRAKKLCFPAGGPTYGNLMRTRGIAPIAALREVDFITWAAASSAALNAISDCSRVDVLTGVESVPKVGPTRQPASSVVLWPGTLRHRHGYFALISRAARLFPVSRLAPCVYLSNCPPFGKEQRKARRLRKSTPEFLDLDLRGDS